jgi:hypothetical protein
MLYEVVLMISASEVPEVPEEESANGKQKKSAKRKKFKFNFLL